MENNSTNDEQDRIQQGYEYGQPQQHLVRNPPEQPNYPGWGGAGMQMMQYNNLV